MEVLESPMEKVPSQLRFFINGKKIIEHNVDPEWTLLYYLRTKLYLPGTKSGCNEGGCGACTVMLSKLNPTTQKVQHISVYACLTLVASLDGVSVITIEGLGSVKTKLHPLQERIALSHGSQCGFCTPGFVMSMYALLRTNPKVSMKDIQENLEGNLCRCTGYRPILEGFSSFSLDSFKGCGKEDCCQLKKNNDWSENKLFNPETFSPYDPSQEIIFPPELKLENKLHALQFYGERVSWYQPLSLQQLLELKFKYPDAVVIGGNTQLAIDQKFKGQLHPNLLNSSYVAELNSIKVSNSGITIGSAVTLSTIQSKCKDLISSDTLSGTQKQVLSSVKEMLLWFGSKQIKNVATLGGNLMCASPVSDLNPILFAAGASATFQDVHKKRIVLIDAAFFPSYKQTIATSKEILIDVHIPFSEENEYFECFKQCRRDVDDISIVNSAMRLKLDSSKNTILDMKLVYGGMDARIKEAAITQRVLQNKKWSKELLEAATEILIDEFKLVDSAPGGMIKYRETLVTSFFYKFFERVQSKLNNEKIVLEADDECISASQLFEKPENSSNLLDPIGKPIVHHSAFLQATGEACFTDDIPTMPNELYAVPILSSKASATILNFNDEAALKINGVHAVFTARDLTVEQNLRGIVVKDEQVFADPEVHYVGEVIGIVIADSKAIAVRAVKEIVIEYQEKKPIITIEEAIDSQSFWEPRIIESGEFDLGFEECEHVLHGDIRIGGQEHFYIETQSTLAVPNKDGDITLYSATQHPSETQKNVSDALGIPLNRVICKANRLGGGFGGKEIKSGYVATYAAIAAHKLNRPVRIILERTDDMMLTGGRHPFLANWKVGFKSDGRLVALDLEMFANGGYSLDVSDAMAVKAVLHADNVYRIPHTRIKCTCCQTNLASNTACRGTGAPQSMLIMEDIITRIAAFLKIDQTKIRETNIFKISNPVTHYGQILEHCSVKDCWDQVLHNGEYTERLKKINEFNMNNRFRKRGLSAVPSKMAVSFGVRTLEQAGALVHIYKDGSVLLNHGGVEMGQGLHTKMIQIASRVLGVSINDIRVSETATDKIPNTSPTAASCSSDLNGMAVKEACETLKKRLLPYLKNGKSFVEAIDDAYADRIQLSATGFYRTPGLLDYDFVKEQKHRNPINYFSYGAALSEVEIDVLTGSHKVLRTDIVMDVGQSLNPAIDIGQIEGAFVFGYGLYVLEEMVYDSKGKLLTNGPSNYKIPSVSDIPKKFNVFLLKGSSNPKAVYSSRGVGEPPLFLSSSVFFAIKEAIRATRKNSSPFRLDSPASAERIRLACQDDILLKNAKDDTGTSNNPWSIRA